MRRKDRFTFVCNENERRAIERLAKRLQRSRSDAVRFLIHDADKTEPTQQVTNQPAQAASK